MNSKLQGIYVRLNEDPIPVRGNLSYGVVDYGLLHPVIFAAWYNPFALWRLLAVALQGLVGGDASVLWSVFDVPLFECDCDPSKHAFEHNQESLNAYLCNDGDAVPPEVGAARAHYQESVQFSSFGSFWASFRISCSGWSPEIPKAQFRGPITGNTSFPMLIIGNTADPVTPLSAAKKVSQQFPGSVVLEQRSPGHSSLAAPSVCTAKVVREYFVNGTIPEQGTVCPMDGSPFDDPTSATNSTLRRDLMSSEDAELAEVVQDLARKHSWRPLGTLKL
ncbi:hypothetical protein PQX77_010361 [Marasmius sp. AFHP31]|nr:hypothetical protein PQX77_010361 [Marasmius sp. AFHP31]